MGKRAYVVMMGDDPGEPGRQDWPVCVALTREGAETRAFEITEENFLSNDIGIGDDCGLTEFFTNKATKIILNTQIFKSLGVQSGTAIDQMLKDNPASFDYVKEAYISLNDSVKKQFFLGLDSSHTLKILETELYDG